MGINFQRLETEVGEIGTVVEAAVVLLNQLAQEIRDTVKDEASAGAMADKLDAHAVALSTAIAAGTPGEPV